MLNDSRAEAQDRLVEAAQQRGADAVLAMRFDANDLWNIGQEICAYVTAVKIRNLRGPSVTTADAGTLTLSDEYRTNPARSSLRAGFVRSVLVQPTATAS
jgi:Putative heavy-metal-binding